MTNNPIKDCHAHDSEGEEWLEKRPVCEICGYHLQGEGGYFFEGKWYHQDCFFREYWEWLEE